LIKPAIPANEEARIAALRAYDVLDSEPDPQFDALAKLAAHIAGVPMALVTLIDTDRQWFKARYGIDELETTRDESFCGHAVASGAPLVVTDAKDDQRFFDNPLVTGSPHVRFYAGMPLRTPEGHVLGTLCALDQAPRELTAEQLEMLDALAGQAVALLEARRRNLALQTFRRTLDQVPDSVSIIDADTLRFEYVNASVLRQASLSRQEMLELRPLELLPEGEQIRIRAAFDVARADPAKIQTVETSYRDPEGLLHVREVNLQYVAHENQPGGRFITVSRDVSARRRVEELQAEFISTVSHELRTPLTSIRGSLGLVAGGITGPLPAEAKEYVNIALSNSDRLVRLINDILDVEKMSSGKMDFRIRSLPLRELITGTVEANAGLVHGANATLRFVTDMPDVEVAVDADRFAQVLTNLISNAAKFSPPGAEIELGVEPVGSRVAISVRDHGPGVPPEFRARIFQRFSQAESSTTRAKGGTGLGLAICKSIVGHLGGSIRFEDADGGGARFVVELPALPPVTADATGPRVLVVEDDADVYNLIERALADNGFAVDIAPTLERARRLLAVHEYAAVTLDLVLGDGDGCELLPELSRRSLPVIVVSGSNRELGRAAVFVTDVIAKPFREERLLEALRRVITTTSPQPRVLHIEDDADLRRIVRRTLPAEWDVTGAETLAAARELLAEQRYDAVVIDLVLPDGNGAELIPLAGSARVIVFSAQDVGSDVARRVTSALVKTRSTADDLKSVLVSLVGAEPRR